MKLNSLHSCLIGLLLLISNNFLSQIAISNTAPNNDPNHLIQNILSGGGVTITNVTFTGNNQQIGSFTNGAAIGMPAGIVMSSGHALDADLNGNPGTANTPANGTACVTNPNTVCNDLLTVANSVPPLIGQAFNVSGINDMCVLEFDFIPQSDTVKFNFSFGSEEYLTWVNSSFNDVFGFFICGPGITGPYSSPAGFPNGSENIAVVPGSVPALPITVSSVHPGLNGQFYNTGVNISYNGYTNVFTAIAAVQCNQTYHIRLAVADGSDDYLDSGVFLEAGSFASDAVNVSVATVSGDTTIVEGCTSADFIFSRPQTQLNDTLIINYTITGTSDTTDYDSIPSSIIFLPGDDSLSFTLNPIQDGLNEGFESVIISVEIINACGDTIISQGTIWIGDGPIINVFESDTLVLCASDSIPIYASSSGGYSPYTYVWNTGETSDTILGSISQNGTVDYYVTATDNCGFSQTDTVTITMNQALQLDTIISFPSSCVPNGAVSASIIGATGTPFYTWTGPGINSPNSINASVWQNLSSGWYYFSVVDDVCSLSDSAYIDLVDSPQASILSIPESGCSDLGVIFINTSLNADNFEWNFDDGTNNTTNDTSNVSHVFSSTTPTTYTVQMIASQNGTCPDTVEVIITVDVCGCTDPTALNYNPDANVDDGTCILPEPIITAPNVFTPNGDGNNDLFELDWTNLTSLELTILNRWGNVLYNGSSDNLENDPTSAPTWNGKVQNDGSNAADGVYFYRYKVVGMSGNEIEGHGFVQLINK